METQSINQALAQIESNLIKLDSARVQVEKVTESSSNLTEATHQLAVEVKSVVDIIARETSSVIQKFSVSLQELDKMIAFSIGNSERSVSTNVEKFSEATKRVEVIAEKLIEETGTLSKSYLETNNHYLSESSNKLFSDFSFKLSELEKAFYSLNEQGHQSLTHEIEKFNQLAANVESKSSGAILELKEQAYATIQKQEAKIAVVINTIVDYSNEIHLLIKQINEMNLPDRLDKINSSVFTMQERFIQLEFSLNKKHKKSFTLIVASAIIIIGLLVGLYFK